MGNNKKIISDDAKDIKKKEENRDTSGDTKVFQIIRREDIEREKRRQAIQKENSNKNITNNKENVLSKKNNSIDMEKQVTPKPNKIKNQILQSGVEEEEVVQSEKSSNKALETNKVLEKDPSKYNNYQEKNTNVILNDYQNNQSKKEKKKKENNTDNTDQKSGRALKAFLIIIIIALIMLIISTAFGVINLNSEKIVRGIKVNSYDISNKTKVEAEQYLNNTLNSGTNNVVTVKRGDYQKQISLKDIDGKFNIDDAINTAYNIGRDNNIVHNNYKTIQMLVFGNNIKASFTYNEELLEQQINEISIDLPDLAIDASYIIDGNKLIIKNSVDGVKIKKDEFKQSLIDSFGGAQKEFELPLEKAENQEIDIEKIHNEIFKEPVNAYYTSEPFKVYKEEYGLDFAISMEEAKKLLVENKQEYEIELKELKPQITVADLGDAAFPDTLGEFTTTYGVGDVNRNANIALAAQSINSVVVMPGEVFSYNDLIGDCSIASGYKTSTIYLNGQLSTGVGGGICQVSTTLYNAVLRANLEIVQRRNHSLGVTYVPAGQDAMVNIGTSDFKFKNNREYPIKVIAYVNPGSVTCAIKGLKQDTEYEVKLESRTIEKNDTRYKVETYKVLYLNGNVVSRTWLSTDTYKYH